MRKGKGLLMRHCITKSASLLLASLAAVFRDVTQCFPQKNLSGERCVTSRKTAANETTLLQTSSLRSRREERGLGREGEGAPAAKPPHSTYFTSRFWTQNSHWLIACQSLVFILLVEKHGRLIRAEMNG